MPNITINPINLLLDMTIDDTISIEIPSIPNMTISLDVAQGPSGSNVSTYATRIDQVDTNTIYRGEASTGSSEGSNSWRIQKLVVSGSDVSITWANGNNNFDKSWTNRLSYTYS